MKTTACGTIRELASYFTYDHEDALREGVGIDLASIVSVLHPGRPARMHVAEVGDCRYEVYQAGAQDAAVGELVAELGRHGYEAEAETVPTKANGYPTVRVHVRAREA